MPSIFRRAAYEIAQSVRGRPSSVFIDITDRCEYRCRMCRFWSDGEHDAARELDAGSWKRIVDEVRDDLGVRRLRFVGGEPFLHPGLLDVAAHAHRRGMHVNVVTNGAHVDADMAARAVAARLDAIRVSVDAVGERHDRLRGRPGAFAQAEAAIRHLIGAKREVGSTLPEIQVYSLVTALNPDDVPAVRAWTRGFDEPIRFFFGPVAEATPAHVAGSTWEGAQLADGFHLPFAESLVPPRERTATRGRTLSARLARVAARLGVRPHCPEAHNLHLDAFGRVRFCAYYRTYAFGVHPRSRMREIWFSRRHLRFLRDIHRAPLPICRDLCGLNDVCFEGNLPQLSRQLLLSLVPSPLRGGSGEDPRFVHDPPDEALAGRRNARGPATSIRTGPE